MTLTRIWRRPELSELYITEFISATQSRKLRKFRTLLSFPHLDDGAPAFPPASSAKPQRSCPAKAHRSPSPSPPQTDVPPFLLKGSTNRAQDEQALRNQFRQFWMASVADAFRDDLEHRFVRCAHLSYRPLFQIRCDNPVHLQSMSFQFCIC